jgi:hypothetical protein
MIAPEDIVLRLRRGGGCVDVCSVQEAASGCQCAEAADEIERLRVVVATYSGWYWTPERRAEFERGKARFAQIKGAVRIRMPVDYVIRKPAEGGDGE